MPESGVATLLQVDLEGASETGSSADAGLDRALESIEQELLLPISSGMIASRLPTGLGDGGESQGGSVMAGENHPPISFLYIEELSRMPVHHRERHRTQHVGWLRAAVLGANDGIVSTASLVLGVAAAHGTRSSVLVAGVAGLVAGTMSMAAGEYVSVIPRTWFRHRSSPDQRCRKNRSSNPA